MTHIRNKKPHKVENLLRIVLFLDNKGTMFIKEVKDEKVAAFSSLLWTDILVYLYYLNNLKRGTLENASFKVQMYLEEQDRWIDYYNDIEKMDWDTYYKTYYEEKVMAQAVSIRLEEHKNIGDYSPGPSNAAYDQETFC